MRKAKRVSTARKRARGARHAEAGGARYEQAAQLRVNAAGMTARLWSFEAARRLQIGERLEG